MQYVLLLLLGLLSFSAVGCGPNTGTTQLPTSDEPSGDESEPETEERERE